MTNGALVKRLTVLKMKASQKGGYVRIAGISKNYTTKRKTKAMSSIHMRHTNSTMTKFANRDWFYEFKEIPATFKADACESVANRLLQRYSIITKDWAPEKNSEWVCRTYFASKLILAATLHFNAERYAAKRNLRVVSPYLRYYSVLCLLRAICYTLPEFQWNDGQLIQIQHSKAISGAVAHLEKIDPIVSKFQNKAIRKLKAERELISYRAPSVGDHQVSPPREFWKLCSLLAEVAQFNSELFEISIHKHADQSAFVFKAEYMQKFTTITIDGFCFNDSEDAYRLDYLMRKHPYPANLQHFMTEGHVDDFFGAWVAEETNENEENASIDGSNFDPDGMWGAIFDIP